MTQEFLYSAELISAEVLAPVRQALADCSWPIELRSSGFDGTFYLRTPLGQNEIDLDMDSGQSHRFLFGGRATGTLERTLSLLGSFSRCLTAGGFPHRIEVNDAAQEEVGYFHYRWPHGEHEPT